VFARQVIEIFTGENGIVSAGIVLVKSQSAILPLHVWVIISTGLFQGIGKSFQAGFLGLSRQLICLIPTVFILSKFFGLTGLTCSQAVSDCVAFIICLIFIIPMIMNLNKMENESAGCAETEK
jgi:Na+-driven multidrug efflux pump